MPPDHSNEQLRKKEDLREMLIAEAAYNKKLEFKVRIQYSTALRSLPISVRIFSTVLFLTIQLKPLCEKQHLKCNDHDYYSEHKIYTISFAV